ncbi:uncharacterized protein LOC117167495 isoform X1 [Belonocnema kinseyi]|uniref:uncharacterized protein LOC117167495 isoform X1 n=1 Tax=Belonocnema kinseyi TaxID=2817044 RepID=UPI00143DCC27|nr:uncharacterized protein LOC117167495 isoform X1 [Belonocnema kinseyi]
MGDESLKTFGIVIRALRSLAEIQLLTPQQILNYVSTQYNIPKEKIKRKLGAIFKRCKEFGILKKGQGHQKVNPNKVQFMAKRPCCDCKDCTGSCGYCDKPSKKSMKEKCANSKSKKKMKMCRSSCKKSKRKMKRRSKRSKKSKRSCKKKCY